MPARLSPLLRNDLDLLSRIKRRDPLAMGELYDRHGKTAYTVILRIVPEQRVAEDLLAECFVIVWNQIARWKDARIEDLRLWLLILARNHAIEYLRSRHEPLPKVLPRFSALTQPAILQDFPRPRGNEDGMRLRSAFAALDQAQMRILEMASFWGLPPNEIAINLGETLSAVKEATDNALRKLSRAGHQS